MASFKVRRVRRYFATDTDMTSPQQARNERRLAAYGTCPVWAADCKKAGLVVASEMLLAIGPPVPCDVPTCNDSHVHVPPPWDPNR